MKILSFDPQSNSLIVAFKEGGDVREFDNFRNYAYQPSMFDVDNLDDFIKEIAKSGVSIVEQQKKEDTVLENTSFISQLEGSVGVCKSFAVEDLYSTPEDDENHIPV